MVTYVCGFRFHCDSWDVSGLLDLSLSCAMEVSWLGLSVTCWLETRALCVDIVYCLSLFLTTTCRFKLIDWCFRWGWVFTLCGFCARLSWDGRRRGGFIAIAVFWAGVTFRCCEVGCLWFSCLCVSLWDLVLWLSGFGGSPSCCFVLCVISFKCGVVVFDELLVGYY